MSQQSLKQSARVQEKSSAAANVSTESIDVPDQWVYIFYFDCDDTYIRIEGNSPRWPDKTKNSRKLGLSEGDIIGIKCGRYREKTEQGEFKWQGHRRESMRVLKEMCKLRGAGVNVSKIKAKDFEINTQEAEQECLSGAETEPECDSQSPEYNAKVLKFVTESEAQAEDPDEPDLALNEFNEYLNFVKAKEKKMAQGTSGEEASTQVAEAQNNGQTKDDNLEDFSPERFRHLMERIEARIEASTEVTRQFMSFAKKAMEEINRLHENALQNRDDVDNDDVDEQMEETEVLSFNGKNLLALGGNTFRERAIIIANEIWNEEERMLLCIEPRKILSGDRKPADEERTDILRKAMQSIMKNDFSEARYRNILRYVNQQGVDLQKKKKKAEQENIPPVDENQ